MAKHMMLLMLEFKRAFTQLPKILLGTVTFAGLVVLFALTANTIIASTNVKNQATVAIVAPADTNDYTSMLFTYIQDIDSVKGVCSFVNLDKETAYDKLSRNELLAAIIIPDNFLLNMYEGIRTPIELVTANNYVNTISPFFMQLMRSASSELGACEAGVYAATNALFRYSKVADPYLWQDKLAAHYISYAMDPSSYFTEQPITVAGHITMEGFYISTGIIIVLLLCGILSSELLKRDSNTFIVSIRRTGISSEWHIFTKLISISTYFYAIIVALYLILRLVSIRFTELVEMLPAYGFAELLAIYLVIISIFAFVLFVFELCNSTSTASIALFLMSTLSLFISGGILPVGLLPDGIKVLSPYVFTTYYLNALKHMYVGFIDFNDIIILVAIAAVLFGLTSLVNQLRRRCV